MRGDLSTGAFAKRHPYDWYVEPDWTTRQLFTELADMRHERVNGLAIWDPAAGRGNVGLIAEAYGLPVILSDVVDRVARDEFLREPRFFSADFLEVEAVPAPCSIVCNPPYSYKKDIAEAFVRHALQLLGAQGAGRVCMLLPIIWQASQSRYRLFMEDHPPAMVLVLSQRPSMPPGDQIALMGSRAFRGGTINYCWFVWDAEFPTPPGQTRWVCLPPLTGGQN